MSTESRTHPDPSGEPAARPLIMVIDDALDAETFARCERAIDALEPRMVGQEHNRGAIRFRRYQDYAAPDATLFHAMLERLFSPDLQSEACGAHDLAWRWFAAGVSCAIDLQVTSYSSGSRYMWHTDHTVRGRTHNFVLYMTDRATFTGGALEISFREVPLTTHGGDLRADLAIEPARNRLVIMPSHVLHRVTEVRCAREAPGLWETRLTVNGHLRVPGLEAMWPSETTKAEGP